MNENDLRKAAIGIRATQADGERFSWAFKSSRLLSHIRDSNPDEFLNWSTTRESLFVGENKHSVAEMEDILGTKYENYIHDTGFGGADQSYHFAHQLWHLSKLDVDVSKLNVIHEFGSGFGAMPLLCSRMGFNGVYIVNDLPVVSLLRDYYLSNVELSSRITVKNGRTDTCDLFIALWSLSEIPVGDRYIPFSNYYLFAFQESWDGVDNTEWFNSLARHNESHAWQFHECINTNHVCLTGARI